MRKIHLLLLIIIGLNIHVSTVTASTYDNNSPEVKEIAEQFSMQGHADHDISTCQTMQMYYQEIVELLNEGQKKEEIIDYYYSMYGEEGMRVPKKSGFSLLAWTTPFVVLGVAGVGLFIGVNRMTNRFSQNNDHENVSEREMVESEITKAMIDEERKKFF
ncbi:cytochrome c-type biogenesis protein CcmH [Anaerobacillus sp. CMMVII]|uniref:cytochrome c-type biogenesis protein CcmH n=1 Tax=Anaerobacillus sp. CMMVII TaxID=2755588 RepID=UPI0021B823D9|nr:cytochrome c-type biogenesis protein CcmH [Anaerobacillus sp. CMMVII]MCT8139269.1 cytochrome c-type biogenesis protein CcmH [Anaerobacillus sp. CMMVII]